MNDFGQIKQTDEAMLISDVSDEAIENAAGSTKEKAGAFTLSFCSGLDTCPSEKHKVLVLASSYLSR